MLTKDKRKKLISILKKNCSIRRRTNKAIKSQKLKKTNKTIDLLGSSFDIFKKWILHQLYGEMTEENYGKFCCLDHCFPLSKTKLSNQNEIKKTTYWINLRPKYCNENIFKGDKNNHWLYLMQEVKTKYFLKLNGPEG